MIEWFQSGGVIMWPLVVLALGVLGVAIREAAVLRRTRGAAAASGSSPERRSLRPILYWGGVALLVGILGTVVGIVIALQHIRAAGQVSGELVWQGFGVTLVSTTFGAGIFLLSGVLWLVLDRWREQLGSSRGPAEV